jgi:lipooligosaccharide transport system permease protein
VRAVLEYQLLAGRRFWRSLLIAGIGTPLLYVLSLGVGLGTVVNRHGTDSLGVPYLVFVAPAFLAAAALQIATADASYPVMAGFKWVRNYHGMAATPLTPRQICDGTLAFIGLRSLVNSAVYLAIIAAFGGTQRWWVVLAVPAAVLCALSFAVPVAALSATAQSEGQVFNVLFRFIVTPMFLFSGTFYPISRLPEWGRWLARVSPLWHGTELARAAGIGGLDGAAMLGHIGYLLAWLLVGLCLARWRFRVRLERGT